MTKKKRTKPAAADDAIGIEEAAGKRLTDLDFTDALNTMKRRCFGLQAAVGYISNGTAIESGVHQIASDVANEIERLAEAFENERQLRILEQSGPA